MSDALDAVKRNLEAERLRPTAPPAGDGLDDLRALIHILAMALTDGKAIR